MVHVHTAALLGLAHVFRSALECAGQVHEKDDQKEDVKEDASDHGSAPVAVDEHVDRYAHGHSHTSGGDENEGKLEHSGLLLLLGALCVRPGNRYRFIEADAPVPLATNTAGRQLAQFDMRVVLGIADGRQFIAEHVPIQRVAIPLEVNSQAIDSIFCVTCHAGLQQAADAMSDIEALHLRGPQFGPVPAKRLREHFLSRDRFLRVLLNSNRKLGRWRLVAICHVAHVAQRGTAVGSEGLAVLVAHSEEVGFQVHAPLHHSVLWLSTPFGVLTLVYCRA